MLGNIVLFIKALDIRQYDGTNPSKQPEVDRLQQLYVGFSSWYLEKYGVRKADGDDIGALHIFAAAAVDFALEIYKYYEVCVREKRSCIGDTVKATSLRMALRTPLKHFGHDACQHFVAVLTEPPKEGSYKPLDFNDILIQGRDCLSSVGPASHQGKRKQPGKLISSTIVGMGSC
jgi:hypothetical protein